MKRNSFQRSMLIGLFIVLAATLSSCGGSSYSSGGGDPLGPTATVQVVACPVGGTTDISIVNSTAAGFSPAGVTVSVDTTVKWTNNDANSHTVSSTTVPANGTFDASVNPGGTVCLKFTALGAFNYHCSIHPVMTGLVTVQ